MQNLLLNSFLHVSTPWVWESRADDRGQPTLSKFPGYSTRNRYHSENVGHHRNLELSGDGQLLFERSDIEDLEINDDDQNALVELTITDEAVRVATHIESNPDSPTSGARWRLRRIVQIAASAIKSASN